MTIALAASLFVALTIVPVLAYWFLRAPRAHKHAGGAAASGEGTDPELTRAVVESCVTILVANYILTQAMLGGDL